MKMAFKGTLKEFKVPDILQLISLQRKTGILTFTSEDGFITLIFENGMIVGVDAFPKKLEMRVGRVLVKQDFISEEMLQRALAIQKRTNQKIGEILISMGLIGKDTIIESLKTQAVQIVLSLFKWKKGEYNFKIQEYLDEGMKIIEAIPTDNIIMEGVQMLDEWPLIKQLVPEETMVFDPVPVDPKLIEIVGEYEDSPDDGVKTYLTETEANLLKYINGENSVRDLVELGVFTEYKVYKSLYNLVKKYIIQAKVKSDAEDSHDLMLHEELRSKAEHNVKLMFNVLVAILTLLLLVTFFSPLRPFQSENLLLKKALYQPQQTKTAPVDSKKIMQ
jgi:hypothetical protein